jgi:hypothetical protein
MANIPGDVVFAAQHRLWSKRERRGAGGGASFPADLAAFVLFLEPAHQRDFPKHCDASAQRKNSSDSPIFLTSECLRWIHPSSPEHIGETRIGAEGAKLWNEIVYRRVLLEAMLQPAKRFIFFA